MQQIQDSPSNPIVVHAKCVGGRLQGGLTLIMVSRDHVKAASETSNDLDSGLLFGP